jgi:hypothetical protein
MIISKAAVPSYSEGESESKGKAAED